MSDIRERKEVARTLLELGMAPIDYVLEPEVFGLAPEASLTAELNIPFPPERTPRPRTIDPRPDPSDPLPPADVVVVTWTVAELNALADVLTPRFARTAWYRYNRRFEEHYAPLIREGAPALKARRLGSYFVTEVGPTKVLCFKSELHLNQDGIRSTTEPGTATLPVKDLFRQLVEETGAMVILTVGTSGGVSIDQSLGDVVVTRAAKFRLQDEFVNEVWNGKTYTSDWELPTTWFAKAEELMRRYADELREPGFGPPTKRYEFDGPLLESRPLNNPMIHLETRPVLTTDFFEFGTSGNNLGSEGCAVEMGDAVLGLLCEELPNPPRWAIVRNISDPQINADLPTAPRKINMQTHWAVWYYEIYGYWTSVTGALATWAILAGLDSDG